MRLFAYSATAGLLAVVAVYGGPNNLGAWMCAVASVGLAMFCGHRFNLAVLDEAVTHKAEADALLSRASEVASGAVTCMEEHGQGLARRAHLLDQYEARIRSLPEEAWLGRIRELEAENERLRAA